MTSCLKKSSPLGKNTWTSTADAGVKSLLCRTSLFHLPGPHTGNPASSVLTQDGQRKPEVAHQGAGYHICLMSIAVHLLSPIPVTVVAATTAYGSCMAHASTISGYSSRNQLGGRPGGSRREDASCKNYVHNHGDCLFELF